VVVVIHVHEGILLTAPSEVFDELFDHGALLVKVVGPARVIHKGTLRPMEVKTSEEEEIVFRRPKGVTLEVEEHVTLVGLGQETEAVSIKRIVALFDEFEYRCEVGVFS
jgi:transketolase C-terminal domain/subunit